MSTVSHPHDIDAAVLAKALAAAERPDLLQQLVDTSRRIWGVFTSHLPHTLNYPWVAAKLESLPAGSRILDLGAGVTPLPLFLAEKGFRVHTIDPHPTVRTRTATSNWNEWGYFDYGELHTNLTSAHCAISDFASDAAFDAIYSVSVLAHMRRTVWEDALRRCHALLRPGGLLLLAIDLVPATDFLWNHSAGREIEATDLHGTIYDVIDQLSSLQFAVEEAEGRRQVAMSRTDLAFLACRQT